MVFLGHRGAPDGQDDGQRKHERHGVGGIAPLCASTAVPSDMPGEFKAPSWQAMDAHPSGFNQGSLAHCLAPESQTHRKVIVKSGPPPRLGAPKATPSGAGFRN